MKGELDKKKEMLTNYYFLINSQVSRTKGEAPGC